jgi:hypothetical protein
MNSPPAREAGDLQKLGTRSAESSNFYDYLNLRINKVCRPDR